jgi:hypothetical protein
VPRWMRVLDLLHNRSLIEASRLGLAEHIRSKPCLHPGLGGAEYPRCRMHGLDQGARISIVSQLLPLFGVVVGVLASYVLANRQERQQYRRQIRDRDGNELDAYAEYASAVGIMARRAGQVAGARGFDSYAAHIDKDLGLIRLDEAEERRTTAFERVALLGDSDVVEAAHELNQAVWNLEWYVRGGPDRTPAGWTAALQEYVETLGSFHDSARRALAVAGAVRVETLGDRLPHLRYEQIQSARATPDSRQDTPATELPDRRGSR